MTDIQTGCDSKDRAYALRHAGKKVMYRVDVAHIYSSPHKELQSLLSDTDDITANGLTVLCSEFTIYLINDPTDYRCIFAATTVPGA